MRGQAAGLEVVETGWPLSGERRAAWSRLLAVSEADPLFHSLDWQECWAGHFADPHDLGLVCLSVEGADGIAGLFPFCLWRARTMGSLTSRRLQPLGNLWQGAATMRTEYLELMQDPARIGDVTRALCEYLASRSDWDDMVLQDLAEESLANRSFLEEMGRFCYVREIGAAVHDRTGLVRTEGSFQDYLERLGGGTRRRMFLKRRQLERYGEVRCTYAGPGEVGEYLDLLNSLHRIRWGEPVFEDVRLDFHRDLASRLAEAGNLRLSRLSVGGQPLSVLYNVRAGGCEYNLQSGFDDTFQPSKVSLGYLHLGYSLESAFEDESTRAYDLLAGAGKNEPFKHRLCDVSRRLRSFQLVRRPWRRAIYRAHDRRRASVQLASGLEDTTVIVTAAGNPTGYGTARAIHGLAGRIVGIAHRASPYGRSRYWSAYHEVEAAPDALLDALERIARQESGRRLVLLPGDDLTVETVSRLRDRLAERFRFVLPGVSETATLMNKADFYQWAGDRGYPVPATLVASDPEALREALEAVPRPLVVKPVVRTPAWDAAWPVNKLLRLDEGQEPDWVPDRMFELADQFVVQQWVEGGDDDVLFCLVYIDRRGRLVARVAGRKLVQWPPEAGSTAACVAALDHELANASCRLLLESGMRGLGSIEVKRSRADGRNYLIEPTVGRNDHQSHVGLLAGVNLTRLALLDALGTELSWDLPDRRALWIDELSLARRCRHSGDCLAGVRWRDIPSPPGVGFAAANWRDPRPLGALIRSALSKRK